MFELFWLSVLGQLIIFPLYYFSLEVSRLDAKFGNEKGMKIGNLLGVISGWGFFIFWIGIWVTPQPSITYSVFTDNYMIINLFFSVPLIILAMIIALIGLSNVSITVAETHRPEKVVDTGMYRYIRHPQYFGGFLAHIGITLILSASYSLLITPYIALYVYLISKKEEIELEKLFSKDYENYKSKVGMFFPRLL